MQRDDRGNDPATGTSGPGSPQTEPDGAGEPGNAATPASRQAFAAAEAALAAGDRPGADRALRGGAERCHLRGDRRGEAWCRVYRAALVTAESGDDAAVPPQGAPAEAEAALDLFEELDHDHGRGVALLVLARAALAAGDPERSLELHERAVDRFRDAGDRAGRLTCRCGAARALVAAGRPGDARDLLHSRLRRSGELPSRCSPPSLRRLHLETREGFRELLVDALARLHADHPDGDHAVHALTVAEQGRSRRMFDVLDAAGLALADLDPLLARRLQSVDDRLAQAERRWRLAAEAAAAGGGAKEDNAAKKDGAAETQDPADGEPAAGPGSTDGELAEAEEELRLRRHERRHLRSEIVRTSPLYAALDPLSASAERPEVQWERLRARLLDQGSLLLVYALGGERSHLWAVDRRGVELHELPARHEVERRVAELAARLEEPPPRGRDELDRALAAVAASVLAPLAERFAGNDRPAPRRLLVVPDGALWRVPFAALPLQTASAAGHDTDHDTDHDAEVRALVQSCELVHLPTAQALATLRRVTVERRPVRGALAVVAVPGDGEPPWPEAGETGERNETTGARETGEAGDSRGSDEAGGSGETLAPGDGAEVPAAPAAIREILDLAPSHRRHAVLGGEVSADAFRSRALAEHRVVHLAVPALLPTEHAERTRLAWPAAGAGGALDLAAIYRLRLPAEIVVLPRCVHIEGGDDGEGGASGETGEGRRIAPGCTDAALPVLLHGLFRAGSPRVVTAPAGAGAREGALRLLRGLLAEGRAPADALRRAQLSMVSEPEWSDPRHWAGLALHGDPFLRFALDDPKAKPAGAGDGADRDGGDTGGGDGGGSGEEAPGGRH